MNSPLSTCNLRASRPAAVRSALISHLPDFSSEIQAWVVDFATPQEIEISGQVSQGWDDLHSGAELEACQGWMGARARAREPIPTHSLEIVYVPSSSFGRAEWLNR